MLRAETDEQFFCFLKNQTLNWFDECSKGVSLKLYKPHNGISYKITSQFFRIGKISSGGAKIYMIIIDYY